VKESGPSRKLIVGHRNDEYYTRKMSSNQEDEDAVLRQIFDLCSLSPRNTTNKHYMSFPNPASPIKWLEEFNGLDKETYLLKDRELEILKKKLEVHRTLMPLNGMCPCGNVEKSEFANLKSPIKDIPNQTPSKVNSDHIGFELDENDPIFDDDWDGETENIDANKQLSTERVDRGILEEPCSSRAVTFHEPHERVPISDCLVPSHTEIQILNESSPRMSRTQKLVQGDEADHTRGASQIISATPPAAFANALHTHFSNSESEEESTTTPMHIQKSSKQKRRKVTTSIFLDMEAQESGDSASSDDENYDEMEQGEDLESSFVVPDNDEIDEDMNTES
jgi:hypothetical protein